MKYRIAIMLLALMTAVAYAQVSGADKTVAAGTNHQAASSPAVSEAEGALTDAARANISAALGQEDQSYKISAQGDQLRAEGAGLTAVFKSGSVHFRAAQGDLGMSLVGYGYGDALRTTAGVTPRSDQNRVEYRRGALTEWYENGPLGLEQGFTFAEPPAKKHTGPLTVALAFSGDFQPVADKDQTQLTLQSRHQAQNLYYGGLASYDATGKELRTWLEVHRNQVQLKVDDSGATYPVVVDPWVQIARLTTSDGAKYDFFGNSISVSHDGKTIVVAAAFKKVGNNLQQGAVYVFVQPTKGWVNTAAFKAKLTDGNGKAGDNFGTSVALSADAKTIVVGVPQATVGTNVYQGLIDVYVQPTGGWVTSTAPTAQLTASDGAPYDWLGSSVSFDNQSVVAGAYGHMVNNNPYQGAAYVFTRPSAGWQTTNQQNAELNSSDGQAWDLFGYSISSFNGTAVVGAVQATVNGDVSQGASYVYVEPSSGWANTLTENAKLVASDGISEDLFGSAVAISSDTKSIVVGAEAANVGGNGGQGAVYVFVQPSGGWSGEPLNETAKLTASDGVQEDYFGSSVAFNFSANTIAVGAPLAPYSNTQKYIGPGPGRVYTYAKPSGGWATTSTYTQEVAVSGGKNGAEFGISVGLNTNTLAAGALGATIAGKTDQGAVFVSGQKK